MYFGDFECMDTTSDNCLRLISALVQARHPTGGEAGEPPKGGAGNLKESSLSGFSCHEP